MQIHRDNNKDTICICRVALKKKQLSTLIIHNPFIYLPPFSKLKNWNPDALFHIALGSVRFHVSHDSDEPSSGLLFSTLTFHPGELILARRGSPGRDSDTGQIRHLAWHCVRLLWPLLSWSLRQASARLSVHPRNKDMEASPFGLSWICGFGCMNTWIVDINLK